LHCIDNPKKIWWDVRPHPVFGTLEFRMCDCTTKIEEATAIAALTQAIVVKLHRLYTSNQSWRIYRRALIEENKWRAARYGMDADIIVDPGGSESHVVQEVRRLLDELAPVARRLHCENELDQVNLVLERGASYQRQLRVAEQNGGSLQAVVSSLTRELRHGLETD
jgi:carboxylate-amine ligase